jgi:hypothetical protein
LTDTLVGRDALKADLYGTFQHFHVEFQENHVESTLFQGEQQSK